MPTLVPIRNHRPAILLKSNLLFSEMNINYPSIGHSCQYYYILHFKFKWDKRKANAVKYYHRQLPRELIGIRIKFSNLIPLPNKLNFNKFLFLFEI